MVNQTEWGNFPQTHAGYMAKKAQQPVVLCPCRDVINYFCGTAMEITAAYRSHFSFKRWTGPGCKGQLSESLYPPKATGGLWSGLCSWKHHNSALKSEGDILLMAKRCSLIHLQMMLTHTFTPAVSVSVSFHDGMSLTKGNLAEKKSKHAWDVQKENSASWII